ncbi:hypothetical protein VHEMI02968 [[Torrubiella] hemipterigena]|uniref:Uncharacterized protein n=1 Tax=[Torrubiella] hemipterigena TaxID=1531966 RepID=A0A0A1TC14_9HYPO|nr:hypothetical protein VHEMI02968 [[Torrubiella] hemipterigena]
MANALVALFVAGAAIAHTIPSPLNLLEARAIDNTLEDDSNEDFKLDRAMITFENWCKHPVHVWRSDGGIKMLETIEAQTIANETLPTDPKAGMVMYRASPSEKNLKDGSGTLLMTYNLNATRSSVAMNANMDYLFKNPFGRDDHNLVTIFSRKCDDNYDIYLEHGRRLASSFKCKKKMWAGITFITALCTENDRPDDEKKQ